MKSSMISKPVVILSKGRSAQFVPQSDDYVIAACSEAVRLCDRCTFLAVNDVPALESLTEEDFAKTDYLILPQHLHLDNSATPMLAHWATATKEMILPEVLLYKLHTDPKGGDGTFPSFGRCRSISDSLIAYMLHLGFRQFLTCGIETNGSSEYHPLFTRQSHKNKEWRKSIWQHTRNRIKAANGKVSRYE